MVIDIFKRK